MKLKIFTTALYILAAGLFITGNALAEHPGEHPGNPADMSIGPADVKYYIISHIEDVKKKNNGVYKIKDTKQNKELSLNFEKFHMPVRIIEGKTYFMCMDFHDTKSATVYDLDFWLEDNGDGGLKVVAEKVHKQDGVARFTYENDQISELK